MKTASVPFSLIKKTGRLDADFYIGDQAEQKVARAQAALVKARQRLKNAKKGLKQRDQERRKNGIHRIAARRRVQLQG